MTKTKLEEKVREIVRQIRAGYDGWPVSDADFDWLEKHVDELGDALRKRKSAR